MVLGSKTGLLVQLLAPLLGDVALLADLGEYALLVDPRTINVPSVAQAPADVRAQHDPPRHYAALEYPDCAATNRFQRAQMSLQDPSRSAETHPTLLLTSVAMWRECPDVAKLAVRRLCKGYPVTQWATYSPTDNEDAPYEIRRFVAPR